jgi:hypothetical protein
MCAKKLLTITDLTRMNASNVCVAGYSNGVCIRPMSSRRFEEDWLLNDTQVIIRPFAIVEFDFWQRKPDPPHTEDWLIDPNHRVLRGRLAPDQQRALLSKTLSVRVADIFGAPIHTDHGWYVRAGEGSRSLGTVRLKKIQQITFDEKYGNYRIAFTDEASRPYQLAVTDMAFRDYTRFLRIKQGLPPDEITGRLTTSLREREVFLRIGLARYWKEFPDQRHLQITGVHAFPDYLDGRCFADFALSD